MDINTMTIPLDKTLSRIKSIVVMEEQGKSVTSMANMLSIPNSTIDYLKRTYPEKFEEIKQIRAGRRETPDKAVDVATNLAKTESPDMMNVLILTAHNPKNPPRERITAAKMVIDKAGVGEHGVSDQTVKSSAILKDSLVQIYVDGKKEVKKG